MSESIRIEPTPICEHSSSSTCSSCRLADFCIPIALKLEDISELERIVNRQRHVERGEHIYSYGEPFRSIYAVRLGCVKTYQITQSGKEQVTGFYLPGEVFGMDGIANNVQEEHAVALETTAVCSIPDEQLSELSTRIPSLQRHLFRLMGREIAAEKKLATLLSKNTAEERVASLILSLSTRYSKLGLSPTRFRLAMSRADIGNYLGLTIETVSRVLSKMQADDVIRVENKELEIKSLASLGGIALESCV